VRFVPTHALTLLSVTDIVCFVTVLVELFDLTVTEIRIFTTVEMTPEAPRRGALLGWVWIPERGTESKVSIGLLKLVEHLQDVGARH
jgi:hypothetical protein